MAAGIFTGTLGCLALVGWALGVETLRAMPTVTGTTDNDGTAVNGTTYFCEVTAVTSGGESPRSGEVSATPQAPAGNIAPSGIGSDSERYRLTRTVDGEAVLEAGDEALRATIKVLQAAQHGRAAAATGKSFRIVSTVTCSEMFEGLVGTGAAG